MTDKLPLATNPALTPETYCLCGDMLRNHNNVTTACNLCPCVGFTPHNLPLDAIFSAPPESIPIEKLYRDMSKPIPPGKPILFSDLRFNSDSIQTIARLSAGLEMLALVAIEGRTHDAAPLLHRIASNLQTLAPDLAARLLAIIQRQEGPLEPDQPKNP